MILTTWESRLILLKLKVSLEINSTYRHDKHTARHPLLIKMVFASLESTLCEKKKSVLV